MRIVDTVSTLSTNGINLYFIGAICPSLQYAEILSRRGSNFAFYLFLINYTDKALKIKNRRHT